jgi:hypothetical protein
LKTFTPEKGALLTPDIYAFTRCRRQQRRGRQPLFRGQDHYHGSAFELGGLLYGGNILCFRHNVSQLILCHLGKAYFPPSKNNRDFHLVLLSDELADMTDLDLKVMLTGFGPDLDFLYLKRRLLLFGFLQLFRLFIFIAAVIHDLADRRVCIGRYFHQIETIFRCLFQCLVDRYDPYLAAVGVDDPDLSGSNELVDVDPIGFSLPLMSS